MTYLPADRGAPLLCGLVRGAHRDGLGDLAPPAAARGICRGRRVSRERWTSLKLAVVGGPRTPLLLELVVGGGGGGGTGGGTGGGRGGGEQLTLEGPAGQACVDDKGLVAAARIDKVRKVNLLLGAGRGGRPLSGRGG